MHSILRKNIKRLILDVKEVQKYLEILEQDPETWVTESRNRNTILLNGNVKKLELDLDVILSDSFSLGRQFWKDHNLILINHIHRSLAIMNGLSRILKK